MTNSILKLIQPPEPSFETPFVQVDWVWNRFVRRYNNQKTIVSYTATLASYKRFLRERYGDDVRLKSDLRFYLLVHWDLFAIYNAERYWRSLGHKSTTIRASINRLKNVIDFAASEGLTQGKEFIHPRFGAKRETMMNEAYSDKEVEYIRRIIEVGTNDALDIARGYKRTGLGKDPRVGGYASRLSGEGWRCWENVVWYFENILNCDAGAVLNDRKFLGSRRVSHFFTKAAGKHHGGIVSVWKRLGVSPMIGTELISPLIVKLALETGLNTDSICNLKRDCYQQSHILTGLPYLRYYKERSKGEKVLHLSLLDSSESILHLLPRQSEIVRRTIELLLSLTEPLAAKANEEHRNFLLLYETVDGGGKVYKGKRVIRPNRFTIGSWCRSILKSLNGNGEDFTIDIFNIARFRATKITQMVREGYDFFRVQAVAGHASVFTTARYLASHQIAPLMQREVYKTLVQIHRNKQEYEANPLPYSVSDAKHHPGHIYKGIMSDCKNVYDPPKSVKRLPTYKVDQACTYWNMCLLCPNVIITRRHLPLIVDYANEISSAFGSGNLGQVPNTAHYRRTLEVIREIFAEFPEEDIAWAKNTADCSDLCLDPVVYRGTVNGK